MSTGADKHIGEEPIRIPSFVALMVISTGLWLIQRFGLIVRRASLSTPVPRARGCTTATEARTTDIHFN